MKVSFAVPPHCGTSIHLREFQCLRWGIVRSGRPDKNAISLGEFAGQKPCQKWRKVEAPTIGVILRNRRLKCGACPDVKSTGEALQAGVSHSDNIAIAGAGKDQRSPLPVVADCRRLGAAHCDPDLDAGHGVAANFGLPSLLRLLCPFRSGADSRKDAVGNAFAGTVRVGEDIATGIGLRICRHRQHRQSHRQPDHPQSPALPSLPARARPADRVAA